jgi:hypothetical protein
MKRTGVKIKKKRPKSKRQGPAEWRIQNLRGKYKHLDLMKGLVEARKEERQPDSKTLAAISVPSLRMLDKSAASLKKGLASAPIDLSALRKAYVDRATKRPGR